MKRFAEADLESWKNDPQRMPLLLRGARQVGKSFLVESWAKKTFKHVLTINFEKQKEYLFCFESLDIQAILRAIHALSAQILTPGESLLFLDEIQLCPQAIMALRYFKEDYPALHVIGAGSLLEFALKEEGFHMPVGRVQSLYIKPLSFYEYLTACNQTALIDYLSHVTFQETFNPGIAQKCEILLREYFILGGMPAVIQSYLTRQTFDAAPLLQQGLLNDYRNDFGKYAPAHQYRYLQRLLERVPGMIGERFHYAAIDAHMQSRDLKHALINLVDAGLMYRIECTRAAGLPLNATVREKLFKVLFLDIGLVKATSFLSPYLMLREDLMLLNRGMLTEQFVGQELLALQPNYWPGQLFYWNNEKGAAEVDYVTNFEDWIVPIEVKSGKTGSLKSLHYFMETFDSKVGIHLSLRSLSAYKNILSIPLYMISEIPRLINL